MEPSLTAVVEALLFAAEEPLPLRRIVAAVEEATPEELRTVLRELGGEYDRTGRAFRLAEVGGGWQLLTRPELAPWVARLVARPRARLTQASLETLAIVAYKQPVARAELEEIRGVNVEGVLKTLLERDLVTIVGRDEGLGRPLLYGTTQAFLTYFGLNRLEDLPRLEELEMFLSERELAALRDIEADPRSSAAGAAGPAELAGAPDPEREPAGAGPASGEERDDVETAGVRPPPAEGGRAEEDEPDALP